MSTETRNRLVLGVLCAVLLAVIGIRVVPALGGSGDRWWQQAGGGAVFDDDLDVEVLELRTELLQGQSREFAIGRNPWSFGEAPKPPPPEPRVEKPKPRPKPEPRETPKEPEPVEPAKPRPPEVDVTFLGTFGPSERKIAVFYDGESIYNAARGDVLNEKFQVVEIGLESVDLGFVGFPDEPPARLAIGG